MYSLLTNGSWRSRLRNEVGPLFMAALTAELFFKWHSFTLECLGFLAAWYAFGWLLAAIGLRREA
ncbi:MAG: hypothetical protein ACKV2U_24830 [Bryobacteraceae bacterium]